MTKEVIAAASCMAIKNQKWVKIAENTKIFMD